MIVPTRNIQSLQDLERWVSPRFVKRLARLVSAYGRRYRQIGEKLIIRAVCVAMAFADAALEGNTALAYGFEDMMHGYGTEVLEYQGQPLIYDDNKAIEERLAWDATCLLLEEYEPGLQMPQLGYDIAGSHVCMAFDSEVFTIEASNPLNSKGYSATPIPLEEGEDLPVAKEVGAGVLPTESQRYADLQRQNERLSMELKITRMEVERAHMDAELAHYKAVCEMQAEQLAWFRNFVNVAAANGRVSVNIFDPYKDVHNRFENGSCHFGPGSTMNGDINNDETNGKYH